MKNWPIDALCAGLLDDFFRISRSDSFYGRRGRGDESQLFPRKTVGEVFTTNFSGVNMRQQNDAVPSGAPEQFDFPGSRGRRRRLHNCEKRQHESLAIGPERQGMGLAQRTVGTGLHQWVGPV